MVTKYLRITKAAIFWRMRQKGVLSKYEKYGTLSISEQDRDK